MRPIRAMITPSQRLQKIATTIPMMTRMPPRDMPPMPNLLCDVPSVYGHRSTLLEPARGLPDGGPPPRRHTGDQNENRGASQAPLSAPVPSGLWTSDQSFLWKPHFLPLA